MNYSAEIDGIPTSVCFSDQTIQTVMIPLLKHLYDLQKRQNRRILVLIAAPPAAGKSTLVSFLEALSKEILPETALQSAGMDGFHYHQTYLDTHAVLIDNREIPMARIKGAPETFDLASLKSRLLELTRNETVLWPVYDRIIHDPIEDALVLNAKIILVEGNYLLLDMQGWKELSRFADYTISLSAEESLLRTRLIERKIRNGTDPDEAVRFTDFSDMRNIRICLDHTKPADLQLVISTDGREITPKK